MMILDIETQTAIRIKKSLDCNWKFILGNPDGAGGQAYDDCDWRSLHLPHDWSIEGRYDGLNPSGANCGYLPAGIGWYRKTIMLPASWRSSRMITLEFDGVFRNSSVYVNGVLLGERPYGWSSFAYDMTEQARCSERIQIAVRVDNSLQPAARWYTGSGIYGHVSIVATNPVCIKRYGVYVTTPSVTAALAKLRIETSVENKTSAHRVITVRSTVYPQENRQQCVVTTSEPICVNAGETAILLQTPIVENPSLWDLDNPNLYCLYTEVLVDGLVVDDYVTEFGIRKIEFSNLTGFWLNEKNIKLKGVADHRAVGALGAAPTENIIRYRLQMLKTMGANAIRTAHNPQTPEFYHLCNQMGILVMDEIFDGWKEKAPHDYGAHSFAQWWKKDTEDWMLRDRNHPSVILWSIGNETGTDDTNGIAAFIEALDSTRGTTGGSVRSGVSVVGENGASEVSGYLQPNPTLPFVATEAPHTWQVRGMYKTQTWYRDGIRYNVVPMKNLTPTEIFQYDWMESPSRKRSFQSSYDNGYVRCSARFNWSVTRDTAWRMGEFRWTGFDYIGEADYVSGGYPYRLFTSGAIDAALFPKDIYYLYQSMWSDKPMLHILPSWTHPIMAKGTEIPVWVYSNCDSVELLCNGMTLGRITRGHPDARSWDRMQYDWLVPWQKGTLTAVGFDQAGKEQLRTEIKTAGAPARLSLCKATAGELPSNSSFLEQITISTTDLDGNLYPYGENRIYFHLRGPVQLQALDNGNPIDVEPHCGSNNHNAFMGLLKAYLRPSQEAGPGDIIAGAILGEKRLLTTDLVSIDVQQLQLRGETLPLDIAVYYTLDGTIPSKQSALYTQPFAVTIGTTVRAVVYSNNAKLFDMEECFAMTEGLHWQLPSTQPEKTLSLTATPKIIRTACNPQRCLGYDATNRLVLLDTAKEKDNNLWIMEEATDGAYRLLHIATQRYLSYDGSMLSLSEQAAGDNIEWNIHGDREHFDYIQHKNSARKLGVSQMRDGLFMYDKDVQEDTNFESNPAYWTFSNSI